MGKMVVNMHDFSDDEFDFDDEYFDKTYRPLSNLPTPPPSSKNSSASQTPRTFVDDTEPLKSPLLGPAVHLVNMIPPRASLATPSVSLVQAILGRANLSMDTIALAVCILDCLDAKFSLRWRLACPLGSSHASKRHTIASSPMISTQLHIDAVNPELIVLAALVIAIKFDEDRHDTTQYYGSEWGRSIWTNEQINATERCIMEYLGYRIMPLTDRELIGDAMADMERAGRNALVQQQLAAANSVKGGHSYSKSMSTGQAVTGLGLQLTPVDTPVAEECPRFGDESQSGTDHQVFGPCP